MHLSLRTKIIFITVVILTASIATNTFINSRTFSKEYSSALQDGSSAVGQSLKLQLDRLLRLQIPIDELVGFEKQCKEVVEKHEAISYAMVVDMDGNILFHSDPLRQGSKSTLPPELKASDGEEDIIQINSEYYDITIPVSGIHGELVGAVKIGYPASMIAQKTQGLVVYSAVVALVSLAIAIVLLLSSLSMWVTNPLQSLLSAIQDIRESGRATVGRKFKIRIHDEIGQLHFAFNEMLSELEISHEKITRAARELESQNVQLEHDLIARKQVEEALQDARNQLEIRVRERTKELEGANERLRQEIAERERLEAQLLQVQKMESIGRLAGGVAHDFNNLLTTIIGYARFVRDTLEPDGPAWQDIEQVLTAADRAATVTRQLLAFSRQQIIAPKTVNLNDLVMTTNNMLRPLIGENIELVTLLAPRLGLTKVDPGQLEQVMVNLVVNARDAMSPQGGILTIETTNITLDDMYTRTHMETIPGDYVRLTVKDTGHGMSEDIIRNIFEPFFTTKELGKGTGLGLSMIYGIIKQHQGDIEVLSKPGQGTTFNIYLPRTARESEARFAEEDQPDLVGGTEKVLVVEDEPAVRETITRILSQLGYHVLQAANGDEGLRVAQTHEDDIQLLLTDMVMPQMGGRELADRLTSMQPGIKVLFISGYTGETTQTTSELPEDHALLKKPFTDRQLAHKVRDVLGAI